MSNIEKRVAAWLTALREDGAYQDMPDPCWLAEKLGKAGYLTPDLPEPTTIAEGGRGATWGRDVQVWVEDGSARVWVEMGGMTISYTIESARKHGNRMLAAASFAERNQE